METNADVPIWRTSGIHRKEMKRNFPVKLYHQRNKSETIFFCNQTGAAMVLMRKVGLRPEVLGNVDATDGLKIGDIPDLSIVQGLAVFIRKPAKVIVRSELSKKDNEYFTFLTSEGAKNILTYLNDRIAFGETLGPDSTMIVPNYKYKYGRGNNSNKQFMVTGVIRGVIRNAMRPRFQWRPYVLRRFFDT